MEREARNKSSPIAVHDNQGHSGDDSAGAGAAARILPWQLFLAEFLGTGLLIGVGLSVVILDFGTGSPVARWIPSEGVRRIITGFLFGTTGGLIAVSPIGKTSGAHINPVVTLAFWLKQKIGSGHAVGYVLAQSAGAIFGALLLLAWGQMGESIHFGATLPGSGYGPALAVLGEVGTTAALIVGLLSFLGHRRIRAFTPMLFPFLYAVMVFLEAPISGTSTNPARSLGPAIVSGDWLGWWVYWIGPVIGTCLAVAIQRYTLLRRLECEVAKLYHFEHDPFGVFKPGVDKQEERAVGPGRSEEPA